MLPVQVWNECVRVSVCFPPELGCKVVREREVQPGTKVITFHFILNFCHESERLTIVAAELQLRCKGDRKDTVRRACLQRARVWKHDDDLLDEA